VSNACPQAEAYEILMTLSPFDIKMRLRRVLAGYEGLDKTLFRQESLHSRQSQPVQWVVLPQRDEALPPEGDWWHKRQLEGSLKPGSRGLLFPHLAIAQALSGHRDWR
jgi:phosphorylase kinase alpha/beta subunit